MQYENFKSDFKLEVTLMLGGAAIAVPAHDFELVFSSGDGPERYVCGRCGGEWLRCSPTADNSKLVCYLDDHRLGPGVLKCLFVDHAPDGEMPDGEMRKVVPQELDVELVVDAGEDAVEVDADVVVSVETLLGDVRALADELETKKASNYWKGAPGAPGAPGTPGVGITSVVQTTTSHESEGENIVTVTLSNGQQSTFSVFNGEAGGGGGVEQKQADWNQADSGEVDYIKNKPTIPVVPTTVSSFTNDANYASIPFVTIDSRKTTVSGNNYDTICGNGNGVSLTSGQLLLVYISTDMVSGDYTLYLNIDQSHSYPATSNKMVRSLSRSSGQAEVKCKDIPKYTRLLLQYNGSMWVIVASGTIPADLSGYATTSAVSSAIAGYCPIIEDERTSRVLDVTGHAPFNELVDGQRILMHWKYATTTGTTTLTLTLANGQQTSAIPMHFVSNNQTYPYLHYGYVAVAGFYVEFIYDAANTRWLTVGFDKDTLYYALNQNGLDTSSTSTNLISGKLLRDNFYLKSEAQAKRTLVGNTDTSGTVTLSVNGYHDLGERSAVAVDLPSTYTRTDEFLFTFECSSSWNNGTITLPQGVKLADGFDWSEAAEGVVFQVSIQDGVCAYLCVTPTNP